MSNNSERFIMRDEIFGGTLFDKKLLRHRFIAPTEINNGIKDEQGDLIRYDHWQGNFDNIRTDIPYAPTRIYFETTTGCNLRCHTCFNSSGPVGENEMDSSEVKKCLDGLRNDNIFDIRFSGGEVTTRLNWFDEIRHAIDLGFAVSVNTNGVYLDHDETISKFASLDLQQVTISLDGIEISHDKNRGRGTYQKAIKALTEVRKMGVATRTNTVLTSLSINDAQLLVEDVHHLVDEMAFFHMRMTGRAKTIQERMVGFLELHEFTKQMEVLSKKYPKVRFYFGEKAIQENSIVKNDFGLKIGSPDGLTRLNLLADGSIYAGGYTAYIDTNLKIGNIRDEKGFSILDLWRNSKTLEWYRNFGQALMSRCFQCQELNVRCPGVNVEMELIRLHSPEIGNPNCIY